MTWTAVRIKLDFNPLAGANRPRIRTYPTSPPARPKDRREIAGRSFGEKIALEESLRAGGFPEHVARHLSAISELTRRGRYDRMTDTMCKLTGEAPTNMRDFVKLHAAEFKQRGPAHS